MATHSDNPGMTHAFRRHWQDLVAQALKRNERPQGHHNPWLNRCVHGEEGKFEPRLGVVFADHCKRCFEDALCG